MAASGSLEWSSPRIVPTNNYVSVSHPAQPSVDRVQHVDGSIDHKQTFTVNHEPVVLGTKSPLEFIIHPTPNYFIDMQSFIVDVKLVVTTMLGARDGADVWNTHFINNLT